MATKSLDLSSLLRSLRTRKLIGFSRLLAPVFSIFFGLASAAQSAAPAPADSPNLAGLAHAAIRVADLDKSRAFYQKLGFEEAFSMSQGATTTQSFIKINDRQFLELYPQRNPAETIGFMHVCFESIDIEALNHAYVARGLSPTQVRKAGAGNLLFTMVGPEKQNLEYTQYMPGSKHSNDIGLHLGANRLSQQMVAAGIEMQDADSAVTFYKVQLAFTPAPPLAPGQTWLALPGSPGVQVKIVQHAPGSVFQMYFGVADLGHAEAQLKALQIPVEKQKGMLSIHDPDGNQIIFVKTKPS
jgi:catechol 2,3-dioxygenase-like lactoylglutathione lyase family enzyme